MTMVNVLTLEHQARPRQSGETFFHRGEILVCLRCEAGGSYTITARYATPNEEAVFWADFEADVREGAGSKADTPPAVPGTPM
jgi:hypothetical protein